MKTILSIDDSKAVHAFIDRCLNGTGWKVIHAMSGQEGLGSLLKDPKEFHLVLLDWEMPDLNGPEVLKRIRESHLSLPVVMLTSKNNIAEIEQMMASGATEFVMKPFTPEILIEKIKVLIE